VTPDRRGGASADGPDPADVRGEAQGEGRAGDADALAEAVRVARGDAPCDLLLRGGRLVDVFAGEVREADVAVHGGRVVAVDARDDGAGEDDEARPTNRLLDVSGRWVAPGLIDGHVHVESSMVTLPQFARAVLPRGTVGAVMDPHEIANVHGAEGIRWVLESRRGLPFRAFVMASSCVPSTPLETAGAELDADDLAPLFDEEGVLGLAEMMNFPGVVRGDPGVMEKLAAARERGVPVDGHAPGLSGRALDAYAAAGPGSEHEATRLEEAREKLEKGMRVMIREASTARNLEALAPLVTPSTERRCSLVTDDRHPHDLLEEGHLDHAVRTAVELGIDPVTAWRMASLNTAEWFGLDRRGHGGVAPGRRADLLVLSGLEAVEVERVFVGGREVVRGGELADDLELPDAPSTLPQSVRVDLDAFPGFRVPADGSRIRVIEVEPDQIVTAAGVVPARVEDGEAVSDPTRDLLKLAVVERHGRGGGVGLGFVRGFGLEEGALASSVAHDAHNVAIVGADDASMRTALEQVVDTDGGLAAARGDEVLAHLPLPVAGLVSDRPVEEVRDGLDELHEAARELGGELPSPYMSLSFLTLAVIPELKLTDRGLVDVADAEIVDLWVS
jgi:adenine deaminase